MAAISRWCDLPDPGGAIPAIATIFFAASNTQSFASAAAKLQFRERWLGRYLAFDAGLVFVAHDAYGNLSGYLVGSFDDPALTARFGDIGYFAELAQLTARYPAHLHVNLDAKARGSGTGSELVGAFVRAAGSAGLPGVHVVTGRGARNVRFYERLGFVERMMFVHNGYELVFLGRDLTPAQP